MPKPRFIDVLFHHPVSGTAVVTLALVGSCQLLSFAQTTQADSSKEVEISASVADGLLLQETAPVYPPIAKLAHVQGSVLLHVVISKKGTVEDPQVLTGAPLLQQAAIEAVKTRLYKPYTVDGEPEKVQTTVKVTFSLTPDAKSTAASPGGPQDRTHPAVPAGSVDVRLPADANAESQIQAKLISSYRVGVTTLADFYHDNWSVTDLSLRKLGISDARFDSQNNSAEFVITWCLGLDCIYREVAEMGQHSYDFARALFDSGVAGEVHVPLVDPKGDRVRLPEVHLKFAYGRLDNITSSF